MEAASLGRAPSSHTARGAGGVACPTATLGAGLAQQAHLHRRLQPPSASRAAGRSPPRQAIALVTLHGLEEGPVRPKFERVSRRLVDAWCDWFPGARDVVLEVRVAR